MMLRLLIILNLFLASNALAYTTPVGIPTPSNWGSLDPINGTAPDTATKCPGWPSTVTIGCYYINNLTGNDSGNTYGTPNAPRATIPTIYQEGAYVEVHGGPYSGNQLILTFNGSESNPVWFRGDTDRTVLNYEMIVHGSYVILENLEVTTQLKGVNFRAKTTSGVTSTVHHGVLRNSKFTGTGVQASIFTAVVGVYGMAGYDVHDIIIYNNQIDHFGNVIPGLGENDYHGVKPQSYCNNVWILNNTSHELGGDTVQVGDAVLTANAWPHHIYIGDNISYGNYEDGNDIKQCRDIVISSNEYYNHLGSGIVIHNNGANMWVINNKVHGTVSGIISTGVDGLWIIGNLVYDFAMPAGASLTNIWTEGVGIKSYSSMRVSIIGNTLYNYFKGICLGSTTSIDPAYIVKNNAFGLRNTVGSNDIIYDQSTPFTNSLIDNNIFPLDGTFAAYISGTPYTSLSAFQATGKCANCLVDTNLTFNNPGSNDYTLFAQSDAIGNAESLTIYSEYPYSTAINYDILNVVRPQGGTWDIGAYEYDEGYTPSPTCDDLVQNGDETGVDCGGSCPACVVSISSGKITLGTNKIYSGSTGSISIP